MKHEVLAEMFVAVAVFTHPLARCLLWADEAWSVDTDVCRCVVADFAHPLARCLLWADEVLTQMFVGVLCWQERARVWDMVMEQSSCGTLQVEMLCTPGSMPQWRVSTSSYLITVYFWWLEVEPSVSPICYFQYWVKHVVLEVNPCSCNVL